MESFVGHSREIGSEIAERHINEEEKKEKHFKIIYRRGEEERD